MLQEQPLKAKTPKTTILCFIAIVDLQSETQNAPTNQSKLIWNFFCSLKTMIPQQLFNVCLLFCAEWFQSLEIKPTLIMVCKSEASALLPKIRNVDRGHPEGVLASLQQHGIQHRG